MASYIKLDGNSVVEQSIVADQAHIDGRSDGPWTVCPSGVGIGMKKTGSLYSLDLQSSRSVPTGLPLTLCVSAVGLSPTYQWKKDASDITGETASVLNIASAASGDAGSYTCLITDGVDQIEVGPCVVTVS